MSERIFCFEVVKFLVFWVRADGVIELNHIRSQLMSRKMPITNSSLFWTDIASIYIMTSFVDDLHIDARRDIRMNIFSLASFRIKYLNSSENR